MKASFVLIALSLSKAAFANPCAIFAGSYQSEDGQDFPAVLTIKQTGCDEVNASYDYGNGFIFSRDMIFDGKSHTVIDTSDLQSIESYTWVDGRISVVGQEHLLKVGKTIQTKGSIYLNESGDLIEETDSTNPDGLPIAHDKKTYKKL